ncbi:ABC transporter substrate-binding protein [Teichococcus cervicalis]|uniref:ABC transporter, substrate-binding protein, family 5 n=1 Tax=Pseudoroseomonas cervicalis ATCC 49957 TaxID=525371 RepID=D5RMU3_9PROT|nr:ABC transporter substrate-binding protein [Pseudoroseomonas cervicalis]EFH11373.1 ABC transporter, substrate-binding protein, family 5 [Pseudoroseomonas cervicalis ATCC 49957]
MQRRDLLPLLAGLGLAPFALPGTLRAQPQAARRLSIAFGDPVSSLDPQLNNFAGDRSVDLHFFDLLIENRDGGLQPGLATAWRTLEPTLWEFTLRQGVTWHDGRPFTAADVVYSYNRAPSVPGSTASFAGYLRTVAEVKAVDDHTLHVRTREVNPLLPLNLASVHIVSRHATEGASNADFNSGKAVIGTGPYRFQAYTPGERVRMRRNESYWGRKPEWAEVDYRYIPNAAARTAALLAGDVDVIDKVSVSDLAQIRGRDDVRLYAYPGLRMLLLQPSFSPSPSRYALSHDGQPLPRNPLLDVRVRRALSIAVNREALCERLLLGTGTPTGQWMPEGSFGYDPQTPVPGFEPERARALLAEAGYPNGFQLTIHLPNDRYVLGPQAAQAIAQMWARIGVRTQVEAVPWSVYSAQVRTGDYAMTTLAWGNGTGEGSYALTHILGSYDAAQGRGVSNWGRYASAEVDRALDEANAEFDDAKREAILQRAVRVVAGDVGIIPLFHYQNLWAAKRGLKVTPLTSDRTAAQMVTAEG